MAADSWEPETPSREAYSRVTNPERFAPLHNIALELLDRLALKFQVERTEQYGLDSDLEKGCKLGRPSIMLVPQDLDAAPIVVAFSTFPGLRLRLGRWYTTAFPLCGCDACNETLELEADRLESLLEDTTKGRFRESIVIPTAEDAWTESAFGLPGVRFNRQSRRLDPAQARKRIADNERLAYEWRPWPQRN